MKIDNVFRDFKRASHNLSLQKIELGQNARRPQRSAWAHD
jgi:hypothetical protein